MLFKKKKFKRANKKIFRNYKLNLDDYSLIEFYQLIVSQIEYLKEKIKADDTSVLELADLIQRRNVFMRLSVDLGFTKYEDDIKNLLPVNEEVESICDEWAYRNSSIPNTEKNKAVEPQLEVSENGCL